MKTLMFLCYQAIWFLLILVLLPPLYCCYWFLRGVAWLAVTLGERSRRLGNDVAEYAARRGKL